MPVNSVWCVVNFVGSDPSGWQIHTWISETFSAMPQIILWEWKQETLCASTYVSLFRCARRTLISQQCDHLFQLKSKRRVFDLMQIFSMSNRALFTDHGAGLIGIYSLWQWCHYVHFLCALLFNTGYSPSESEVFCSNFLWMYCLSRDLLQCTKSKLREVTSLNKGKHWIENLSIEVFYLTFWSLKCCSCVSTVWMLVWIELLNLRSLHAKSINLHDICSQLPVAVLLINNCFSLQIWPFWIRM